MHFAVLGAGVVGLNTALKLQRQLPNVLVTIVAEHLTVDTTSDVAAGIFWPSPNFSGPSEDVTFEWIRDSYDHWKSILDSTEANEAGVRSVDVKSYSNTSADNVKHDILERILPFYQLVDPPGNWKYAANFSTLLTDCHRFLPWAMEKFRAAGGQIKQQRVQSLADLHPEADATKSYTAIFNCSGLGARQLCADRKLVPIRGQVVRVHAPWQREALFADCETYIIPALDGEVVLGGVQQYDNDSLALDVHDRAGILARCEALSPGISTAPVLREATGLRPHRGEVRVECEEMVFDGGRKQMVVHNYGHGGYGVTSSPGTARYAVGLALVALQK